MLTELITKAEAKLAQAVEYLSSELKAIHSARANPALVEDLPVVHYDQNMTLKQLANISAPDAKSLTITPWDPTSTATIEKAIMAAKSLDLNPISDGKIIHINIPPLTEERRQAIAKQVNEKVEQCHISMRNIRHELLEGAERLQKEKQISDDDYHRTEKQISQKIDQLKEQIQDIAERKRVEIMEI